MAQKSLEYHLTRVIAMSKPHYSVCVTYGLCDTEMLGVRKTQKEARDLAKAHAAARNAKPLIIA